VIDTERLPSFGHERANDRGSASAGTGARAERAAESSVGRSEASTSPGRSQY
jgi:hypothetical protein